MQSTVCDLRSILRKTGIRWRGFRSCKIPEGVRFAAASLVHIRLSWLAHDGIRWRGFRSRKIPEGVRFAAAPLFHIRLSWLAHDGIRSRGSTHWLLGEPPGFPRPVPLVRFADKALRARSRIPEGVHFRGRGPLSHQVAGP